MTGYSGCDREHPARPAHTHSSIMTLSILRLSMAGLLALQLNAAAAQVALDHSMGPPAVYRLDDGRSLYLAPMVDENGATLQFALSDGLEGRARRTGSAEFADRATCANRFKRQEPLTVEFSNCKETIHGTLAHVLVEQPFIITASDGRQIGASVWHVDHQTPTHGVVLAHGADDETRQMGVIVPQLAEAGFAVLTFDQRGTGLSEGNWRADGIHQMSTDVAQLGHELARARQMKDVGFFGFSNGGWVAPAAAVTFGQPAFVVIKSGDSGTVEDNVLYETEAAVTVHAGTAAGTRAREVMETMFRALHTDSDIDWNRARAALAAVQGEQWLRYTQLPPPSALPLPAAVKEAYRRQLFFDPREDLRKLTCPVLVMLGDRDLDVDGPHSATLYRRYLTAADKSRTRVILMHDAGHQLVQAQEDAANNSMETGHFTPEYPGVMTQWMTSLFKPSSSPY
ncbi:MAG: alpha/beta hydrolase [Telluria sp.]